MTQALETYIRARIGADDTNLDDVLAAFVPRKVRRNELLLRAGDVCQHCYFVVKGCIQVFVGSDAGDETTASAIRPRFCI